LLLFSFFLLPLVFSQPPLATYYCNKDADCCWGGSYVGVCNLTSKQCRCINGYYGVHCEVQTTYGKNCLDGQCMNGGYCNKATNKCSCTLPWTGDFCEIPTGNYFCTNYDGCNWGGSYVGICDTVTGHCICRDGYYGKFCEQNLRSYGQACLPGMCLNNGTCSRLSRCVCAPDYTGDYCTIPIYAGFRCNFNSDCSYAGSYTGICEKSTQHCICNENTYGMQCELPFKSYGAPCISSSCLNGGFCDPQNKRCQCKGPFTGDYCEFKTNDFKCNSNAECCYAGSYVGVCEFSTRHCICNDNAYGLHCEVPKNLGLKCLNDLQCGGGICSTQSGRCICPVGLTGAYCNINSNGFMCLNNEDCRNGGVCERSTGNCICTDKWTGVTCNIIT